MPRKPYILCAAVLAISLLCGCVETIPPASAPDSLAADITEITTSSATEITETTVNTTEIPRGQDAELPAEVLLDSVPHFDQKKGYATACESYAAVSLLQYYGVAVTPDEFICNALPTADYPTLGADGELHAESPWEYFLGDPSRNNGFGCYSPAIVTAINKIEPNCASALRNVTLETLCAEYLAKGQPVIIWATIGMQEASEGHSWILPDGEWFTFIRPEHALVLIGYDSDFYYFCDSLAEEAVTAYEKAAVEAAYTAMYEQAVVIDAARIKQNAEQREPCD